MSFYVVIRGPLGSGKTTIAKKLTALLKAKYFSIDAVLEENDLSKELEDGYISQRSFIKANEIIMPEAKRILKTGKPVVFDGNFYWKSQIEDLLSRLDYTNYVFTLKAPLKVCIKREHKRGESYGDNAVSAVYRKVIEFNYGITVNANKPLDEIIKEIYHVCLSRKHAHQK